MIEGIVIGILIGVACVKLGPWLAKRRRSDPWAQTQVRSDPVDEIRLL